MPAGHMVVRNLDWYLTYSREEVKVVWTLLPAHQRYFKVLGMVVAADDHTVTVQVQGSGQNFLGWALLRER